MLLTVTLISLIAYIIASLVLTQRFMAPEKMQRRTRALTAIALVGHAGVLYLTISQGGLAQLNMVTSLAIIAWLLSLFASGPQQQRQHLLLRPAVYAFAAITLLLLLVTPETMGGRFILQPVLAIHVTLSLLAFSVLTLASLYAIQILYLNYLLKHHSALAIADHMPPLMALEQLFFRLLTAGTLILTAALAVGLVFMESLFLPGQLHKTSLSLLAWLGYGGITIAHYVRGLRGQRAIYLTLAASALLILAYFGSRFVRDVLLH